MTYFLLDPTTIWFGPYDYRKFKYLDDLTDLIERLLDIKHLTSDIFLSYLCRLMQDPLDEYRELYSKKNQIVSRLFGMIDEETIIDLNNYTETVNPLSSGYNKTNRSDINEYFYKILNYVKENNIECLLFLSLDNTNYYDQIPTSIHLIRHIFEETDSYLSALISDGALIKDDFMLPTLSDPLPNDWLVERYQEIREEIIKTGKSSNTIFLKLGKECALRNGYIFDKYLTRINNSAIREIFKSKTKPTIYLSTDVEHGAIEVFDCKPEHQGEYSYTGNKKPNSKDPKRHKIILHR